MTDLTLHPIETKVARFSDEFLVQVKRDLDIWFERGEISEQDYKDAIEGLENL